MKDQEVNQAQEHIHNPYCSGGTVLLSLPIILTM